MAMKEGYTVDQLWELTKIDKWFLSKLNNIHQLKLKLSAVEGGSSSPEYERLLKVSKRYGFSDKQVVYSSLPHLVYSSLPHLVYSSLPFLVYSTLPSLL